MAGIFNVFKDGDEIKECFAILTRNANQYIEEINDRMPVILYEHELKDWISDNQFIDYVFRRDDVVLHRKLIS